MTGGVLTARQSLISMNVSKRFEHILMIYGIPIATLVISQISNPPLVPSWIVITLLVVHLFLSGYVMHRSPKPTSQLFWGIVIPLWMMQAFMTVSFLQITELYYQLPIIAAPFTILFGYTMFGMFSQKIRAVPQSALSVLTVTSFSLMLLINLYSPASYWLTARLAFAFSFLTLAMIMGLYFYKLFLDKDLFSDKKRVREAAISWFVTWLFIVLF